jgi:hypothetical protein
MVQGCALHVGTSGYCISLENRDGGSTDLPQDQTSTKVSCSLFRNFWTTRDDISIGCDGNYYYLAISSCERKLITSRTDLVMFTQVLVISVCYVEFVSDTSEKAPETVWYFVFRMSVALNLNRARLILRITHQRPAPTITSDHQSSHGCFTEVPTRQRMYVVPSTGYITPLTSAS